MKSKLQRFSVRGLSLTLLMVLISLTVTSCSHTVEVSGNLAGGSPLERIEFIEASGIATLPLTNIGVDSKGSFSGKFKAPKEGMYIMSYAGRTAMLWLKGGQKVNISGQAANFPAQYTVTGDAKNNNDFLMHAQEYIQSYAKKIRMEDLLTKKEADFLKSVEKIHADIQKNLESTARKTSADKNVLDYKKDELNASILQLMNQYEIMHPEATRNPGFKPSQAFKDAVAKLDKNSAHLVETQPVYRNYLLGKLNPEFQEFAAKYKRDENTLSSVVFADFLDTKKDMEQTTKDHLLAFVLASSDMGANQSPAAMAKISKVIKEKIKSSKIQKDLEKLQFVINGLKEGAAFPSDKLSKADGSGFNATDRKGRPALVMFYASWNPYIAEATVPVLKEVADFYKSKVDFIYVNLDDTKEQFVKTSSALLKGLPGTNVYAEGGLQSKLAESLGIYGFKLPYFLILDKEGKIASKQLRNLGEEEFVQAMEKVSGLKAPAVETATELQNDLLPQADEGVERVDTK